MRPHRDDIADCIIKTLDTMEANNVKKNSRHNHCSKKLLFTSQRNMSCFGTFLVLVLVLILELPLTAKCEAKEFDWNDLGMSLSNSKSIPPQNNLRILVSPQRRMTKGYDFEYANSNQTSASGGASDTTSYVVPSSGGGAYLSSTPTHSGQSAAYSALSASLASLKNRLSARGVTLSNPMSDNGSSSLYPASSAYGSSSLILDQTQQGQQTSQHLSQESQPTYLSMSSSQQDPQISPSAQYTLPPSQSNDNKTIVLAIPAKINFLTENRSPSSQKQQSYQQQQQSNQQAQQLTVIQSPNSDQQSQRQEYATKHMESPDQTRTQIAVGDSNQDHTGGHQHYVIVNQPSSHQSSDPHSHLVAANLSPSSNPTSSQIGSTQLYSAAAFGYQQQAQPGPMMSSYAMKYVPTYQAQAVIHQPTVQKLYSHVLDSSGAGPSGGANSYDMAGLNSAESALASSSSFSYGGMNNRYMSCLDTCNSADPRWRKYTVSKYKACCSRSSLYDASYEQPSADRVGEMVSKYNEDAYYNYLYRRSRARKARRQRNRYNRQQLASVFASSSSTSGSGDEDTNPDEQLSPATKYSSTGRQSYSQNESPYVKYNKNRQSATMSDSIDGLSNNGGEQGLSGNKYGKERLYKQRGRARDMDGSLDSSTSGSGESYEDDMPVSGSDRGSSNGVGYVGGNTDYPIADSGRFQSDSGRQQQVNDEEEARTTYDDALDSDKSYSLDSPDYQMDIVPEAGQGVDEHEPEVASKSVSIATRRSKKYSSSNKTRSIRERKLVEKEAKSLSRKGRKGGSNKYKSSESSYATNPTNATNEYEPTQASVADQQSHDSNNSNGNEEEQQVYQRDPTNGVNDGGSTESEKDIMVTKYKQTLNDTAVANLSKTTLHLKEILSLLEKKAILRANETSSYSTSTPAPTTTSTTTSAFYSHSYLGGIPLSLQSSNDYIASELSLKSPYRLETPSLSSSSISSSVLPLSSSSFAASMNSDSSFGSPFSGQSSHSFGMVPSASSPSKQLAIQNMPHSRKRRVPKPPRYNHPMYPKTHGSYAHPSSLMMQASSSIKNPILTPAYYTSLQYTPYAFGRGGGLPPTASSYPYKNIHKSHLYSSAFHHGPSKLSQAGLYSDESRLHGITSYDPLANVASVLRPSATMRLRNKPFMFHSPHLYARQSFLSPVDARK